jgi:hypothetical protein
MLNLSTAQLLFRNHLLGMVGVPSASLISFENRPFTPPAVDPATLWIRETMIIVTEQLAANDQVQTDGFVNYESVYPVGRGTEVPDAMALLIATRFKPVTDLSGSGVGIHIFKTERLSGVDVVDGDKQVWYSKPVRIHWRAFTQNT